jgi:hypothetical protein
MPACVTRVVTGLVGFSVAVRSGPEDDVSNRSFTAWGTMRVHGTALLDAGIPVRTVAQRLGDDPAVLLRNYAKRKRTKKADTSLSNAIEHWRLVFSGLNINEIGPKIGPGRFVHRPFLISR